MGNSTNPEEVFTDTNVGYNYAFNQDEGASRALILTHGSKKVASDSVCSEFENLIDKREDITNELIKEMGSGDIANFTYSEEDDLSPNDEEFLDECIDIIKGNPEHEAVIRLEERLQKLKKAYDELFCQPQPYISKLPNLNWSC